MDWLLANEWALFALLAILVLSIPLVMVLLFWLGRSNAEQATYWADVIAEIGTAEPAQKFVDDLGKRADKTATKLDDMAVEAIEAVQRELEAHLLKRSSRQGGGDGAQEGDGA